MEKTIETIQQEQPAPTCKSCGFYENNCPFIRDTFKPYPNKVCKDYTYSAMKEQEQADVDLEREIIKYKVPFADDKEYLNETTLDAIARHFYELGQRTKYQQDREEFAKLKVKEWQSGYDEGYAKGLNARKEE